MAVVVANEAVGQRYVNEWHNQKHIIYNHINMFTPVPHQPHTGRGAYGGGGGK
jgi:hypothetical protein